MRDAEDCAAEALRPTGDVAVLPSPFLLACSEGVNALILSVG